MDFIHIMIAFYEFRKKMKRNSHLCLLQRLWEIVMFQPPLNSHLQAKYTFHFFSML